MAGLTAAGTPALYGPPGMGDNDEPLSLEQMLQEMAERGTAAIGVPAPGVKGSGVTLGPGVTVPPGGEAVEETARRMFGAGRELAREAGRAAGMEVRPFGLPSWWPYAAIGGGVVLLWWLSKRGK